MYLQRILHLVRLRLLMQDITALYKENFNTQDYVKKFLGPDSPNHQPAESSEVSVDSNLRVALSRLNISIREVDLKIHELVTQNSSEFLECITDVSALHNKTLNIHNDLVALNQNAKSYVKELPYHTEHVK